MTHTLEDIVLQYTYPRLDAEVSKHRNHLLKAPFCIHPKTGRVCVPVDPATIERFNPEEVPTVNQLLNELDSAIIEATPGEHHSGKILLTVLKSSNEAHGKSHRLGKDFVEAVRRNA